MENAIALRLYVVIFPRGTGRLHPLDSTIPIAGRRFRQVAAISFALRPQAADRTQGGDSVKLAFSCQFQPGVPGLVDSSNRER
jgi:hypothetical protein